MFKCFEETLKLLSQPDGEKSDRIADSAALYSDIVRWDFPQFAFSSGQNCLAAIVLLSFLGMNADNLERLRNQIARVAYNHNNEGTWQLVQEVSRTAPFVPYAVMEKTISHIGTHSFFGNLLPTMKKIKNNMKVSNIYTEKKVKVVKPQRKRGYNDKGHLRPSHISVIGRESKPREPFESIEIEGTFFSDLAIPDRSNTAAGLMSEATSKRRVEEHQTQKRVKEQFLKYRLSGKYPDNYKIIKIRSKDDIID